MVLTCTAAGDPAPAFGSTQHGAQQHQQKHHQQQQHHRSSRKARRTPPHRRLGAGSGARRLQGAPGTAHDASAAGASCAAPQAAPTPTPTPTPPHALLLLSPPSTPGRAPTHILSAPKDKLAVDFSIFSRQRPAAGAGAKPAAFAFSASPSSTRPSRPAAAPASRASAAAALPHTPPSTPASSAPTTNPTASSAASSPAAAAAAARGDRRVWTVTTAPAQLSVGKPAAPPPPLVVDLGVFGRKKAAAQAATAATPFKFAAAPPAAGPATSAAGTANSSNSSNSNSTNLLRACQSALARMRIRAGAGLPAPADGPCFLLELPDELIMGVLSFLGPRVLQAMHMVHPRLGRLATDRDVRQHLNLWQLGVAFRGDVRVAAIARNSALSPSERRLELATAFAKHRVRMRADSMLCGNFVSGQCLEKTPDECVAIVKLIGHIFNVGGHRAFSEFHEAERRLLDLRVFDLWARARLAAGKAALEPNCAIPMPWMEAVASIALEGAGRWRQQQIQCFACSGFGHIARNCPIHQEFESDSDDYDDDDDYAYAYAHDSYDDSDSSDGW